MDTNLSSTIDNSYVLSFLNTTTFYLQSNPNPFSSSVMSTAFSWSYFAISAIILLCIAIHAVKLSKTKDQYKDQTFSLLFSMKTVLTLPLEHIIDMTTDIAVLIYWVELQFDEFYCDCGPYFKYLNMGRMFIMCAGVHCAYRVLSARTIYRAMDALNVNLDEDHVHVDTNWYAAFRAGMQCLFDTEILIAVYYNLKMDHTKTVSAVSVIRSFEGNIEAFGQSVIQLTFALRTTTEHRFSYIVLFSLFWSMKSTLFAWYNFDKSIMIPDASDSNFEMIPCDTNKCKYPNLKGINGKFIKRMIWRTCNVVGRVCLISYFWIVVGYMYAFFWFGVCGVAYTYLYKGNSFGYMGFQFFVGIFIFPPDYHSKYSLSKVCCISSIMAALRFLENLCLYSCVVYLCFIYKDDIEDKVVALPFGMRSDAVTGNAARQCLFVTMSICLVLDFFLFYKWKISSFVVKSVKDMPFQITLSVIDALKREDNEDYEFLKQYLRLTDEGIAKYQQQLEDKAEEKRSMKEYEQSQREWRRVQIEMAQSCKPRYYYN